MASGLDHNTAPIIVAVTGNKSVMKLEREKYEEGREEVILNMLKANMEEKVVAQIIGTTISRVRQIKEKPGL